MILDVKFRDAPGNTGGKGRQAESLELVAEGACDLIVLGELARLLATVGGTTTEAVRELTAAWAARNSEPAKGDANAGYG
jgi:hypothetical protein